MPRRCSVIDAPGGGGKIQLAPDPVAGRDGDYPAAAEFRRQDLQISRSRTARSGADASIMRIGVTYDLRSDYLALGYGEEETAEFDAEETIAAVCEALADLGHQPVRIGGIQPLTQALAAGERWDAVFNICEGLKGVAREAQVPALLEAYRHSLCLFRSADPGADAGQGDGQAGGARCRRAHRRFRRDRKRSRHRQSGAAFPAVPQAGGGRLGQGRGCPLAWWRTAGQLASVARDLLARFRQPVLVEEFLPGREFTVGITGTGEDASVLGVSEIVPKDKYRRPWLWLREQGRLGRQARASCSWPTPRRAGGGRGGAGGMAGAALPRRRARRCAAGQKRQAPLHRGQSAGRHPARLFRSLLHRRISRSSPISDLIGKFLDSFLARHPGLRMKILVLHSDIAADAPPEEQDTLIAAEAVAKALTARGHAVEQAPFRQEALPALLARTATRDRLQSGGRRGRPGQPGAHRAATCWRRMGVRFTGATAEAMAFTNDKPLTKRKLRDAGLATPDWAVPPAWEGLDGRALDRQSGIGRRFVGTGRSTAWWRPPQVKTARASMRRPLRRRLVRRALCRGP